MSFNINKQKQIKVIDNLLISPKSSYFDFPNPPSNSFLQSSFPNNIFSESCLLSCKPFFIVSETEPSFEKNQVLLFSTSLLHFYKKFYKGKRNFETATFRRIRVLRKKFTFLMRSSLKNRAKNVISSCPKITRFSISQNQTLQRFSLKTQNPCESLKKTYTLLFEVFRKSIFFRSLLFRSSKFNFKVGVFGLILSLPSRRRKRYRTKRQKHISFSNIKFFKKKEKLHSFNTLKLKSFCKF